MASGFFILLRFFLRVDGVIVRLNDTRIYHAVSETSRDYHVTITYRLGVITWHASSVRERSNYPTHKWVGITNLTTWTLFLWILSLFSFLQFSLTVLKDINKLSEILPHVNVIRHKLVLIEGDKWIIIILRIFKIINQFYSALTNLASWLGDAKWKTLSSPFQTKLWSHSQSVNNHTRSLYVSDDTRHQTSNRKCSIKNDVTIGEETVIGLPLILQ